MRDAAREFDSRRSCLLLFFVFLIQSNTANFTMKLQYSVISTTIDFCHASLAGIDRFSFIVHFIIHEYGGREHRVSATSRIFPTSSARCAIDRASERTNEDPASFGKPATSRGGYCDASRAKLIAAPRHYHTIIIKQSESTIKFKLSGGRVCCVPRVFTRGEKGA